MNKKVEKIETEFNGNGRILYRASGTEPLVRIMVEAETEMICKACIERIEKILQKNGHIA